MKRNAATKSSGFTQADIDAAYARGVADGRRLTVAMRKGRGRPKLSPSKAVWNDIAKWLKVFGHIARFQTADPSPRGSSTRAIESAAQKFSKDKRTIERAQQRFWENAKLALSDADTSEGAAWTKFISSVEDAFFKANMAAIENRTLTDWQSLAPLAKRWAQRQRRLNRTI